MKAALTIKAFGIYVVLTGITLLLAPDMMLSLFGAPAAKDGYIRLLGALAIVVGYYYWACGVADQRAFFKATVAGRILFFALGLGLFLAGLLPSTILLFGAVDLLGAGWTFLALKSDQGLAGAPALR